MNATKSDELTVVSPSFKIPESVLVVIYAVTGDVLLIERADSPGFWQSVTGSKDTLEESFFDTAAREVWEETGIDVSATGARLSDWQIENVYEIYPAWRWRYHPDISHNRERVFGLRLPAPVACKLNPREHTAFQWLPALEAADRCASPSNAEAILLISSFSTRCKS